MTLNGKPWFVANDVCRALEYQVKPNGAVNTSHALRLLAPDEVITHQMSKMAGRPPKLISRSGLNKLIMRSNKPLAKMFQDWLARKVIPAIQGGDVKAIMRVMEGAAGVGPEEFLEAVCVSVYLGS